MGLSFLFEFQTVTRIVGCSTKKAAAGLASPDPRMSNSKDKTTVLSDCLVVWWCFLCFWFLFCTLCTQNKRRIKRLGCCCAMCGAGMVSKCILCGLQQPIETSSLKPLAICGVATIRNRRFPCSVLMTSAEVCVQELGDKTNVFCYSRC